MFSQFLINSHNLIKELLFLFYDLYSTKNKNSAHYKIFIIKYTQLNLQLFLTIIFYIVYFYNFNFLGRVVFFISMFFAFCTGEKDPVQLYKFGVLSVSLFLYVNLILYIFVQFKTCKNLLISSVGEKAFAEYCGSNAGTKALKTGLGLGSIAFGVVSAANISNRGLDLLEYHIRRKGFETTAKELEFPKTQETVEKFNQHTKVESMSVFERAFGTNSGVALIDVLKYFSFWNKD